MRTNKKRFITVLVTLLMVSMVTFPVSAASTVKVELGSASTFAVLAGSGITNTGTTTIGGDAGGNVGVYPGTSFVDTGVSMTGRVYLSDEFGIASLAQADLTTAYNDAAGRTPTVAITADLSGTTLTPGVYNSESSIAITGTLTLDAQGDPEAVFIFQAGSTLTTAPNSEVKLINGAQYCRVFWQVGSSATLGTNSKFVGHLLAFTSITANTGAVVQGQLLARNGAVTLDTNTITNGVCAAVYPPLINVVKTPSPLAITSGAGTVIYTYEVTNPGMVELSNITITDDKVSPVNYVSGDSNADDLLQTGETWIYTSAATLTETTTNSVTVTGSANGMSATDIAFATVNVSSTDYPPLINVIKTPSPLELKFGAGSVTYTYKVTNPGMVELSDVSVTDDKVSPVSYVSGDINADNLLQPGETWTYICTTTLSETTMNTATAIGSANGMTAIDMAEATVIVSTPVPVTETVTGGQLPATSTPWYNIILVGVGLVTIGIAGLIIKKKYE